MRCYARSSSSYQGAMSAFLPTLGQNVLRLDADRLKDVFSDVQDGETACVVLLKADEVRHFCDPAKDFRR